MKPLGLCLGIFLIAGCASDAHAIPQNELRTGISPQIAQTGQLPRQWIQLTEPQTYPYFTSAVASAPDGSVWFTETNEKDGYVGMLKMDRSLIQYPSGVTTAIVAGPDNNMWFVDNHQVSPFTTIDRITPAGTITQFSLPDGHNAWSVCNGKDGNVWFTDNKANEVGKISMAGQITEYTIPTANTGPLGCHVGPDHAIWFGEGNFTQIGRIDESSGAVTEFSTKPVYPTRVALGTDGKVWFVAYQNTVGNITTSGTCTLYTVPTQAHQPASITLGPDSNIWFGGGGGIGMVTSAGVITWRSDPFTHGFQTVNGIAAGRDGNLYSSVDNYNQPPQIDVFVRRVLSVSPSSLTLSVGQKGTLTVSETHYSSSWAAASSNTAVATVEAGGSRRLFTVTAIASGTAEITISDKVENTFQLSVVVN